MAIDTPVFFAATERSLPLAVYSLARDRCRRQRESAPSGRAVLDIGSATARG
jgi:hypothetical protein